MTEVCIYTDGACSGNPGPGGYGVILECGGKEKELSGGEADTTNNKMELTAAIKGLSALTRPCRVSLYTDSKYLCDGINKGWAENWKKRGWIKPDKTPAKNTELWDELLRLIKIHEVTFIWIKGHAGHPKNERCDELAVMEASKFDNV